MPKGTPHTEPCFTSGASRHRMTPCKSVHIDILKLLQKIGRLNVFAEAVWSGFLLWCHFRQSPLHKVTSNPSNFDAVGCLRFTKQGCVKRLGKGAACEHTRNCLKKDPPKAPWSPLMHHGGQGKKERTGQTCQNVSVQHANVFSAMDVFRGIHRLWTPLNTSIALNTLACWLKTFWQLP